MYIYVYIYIYTRTLKFRSETGRVKRCPFSLLNVNRVVPNVKSIFYSDETSFEYLLLNVYNGFVANTAFVSTGKEKAKQSLLQAYGAQRVLVG